MSTRSIEIGSPVFSPRRRDDEKQSPLSNTLAKVHKKSLDFMDSALHESELARLQLSKKITRLNEQVETLEKELSATTDHATELEENLNQAQKQITQLRQQYVQLRDENIDNFSNF